MIIKTKDRTQALARIEDILDPGSFMEIGEHITAHLTSFYDPGEVTESDGVITGYGTVDSHLVFVFSQDAEVMGGTFGEMHGRKIKDLYARALKAKAPVIGIMDCKGFRIEEGLDGLDIFASLYAMQARAAERIPQIIAVVGDCGGGMSLSAVMADFVFIEKEKGNIFVNSQNLVENDLGGSGYISAFDDGRYDWSEIVGNVQALIRLLPPSADYDPLPAAVTDDLNRPCLAMAEHAGDARYIIREIADDHYFFEAQPDKAEDLITGFIRLAGWPVGVVACNEVDGENRITSAGCDKATSIVNLCRKFNLPLLTITDTEGYKTTEENEKYLPNAAGRLIKALTALTTPKVNLIVDRVYGSAYSLMNSKGLGADYVFMWNTAEVSILNPHQAVEMIYGKYDAELAAKYEETYTSALALARRGYVDKVIQPEDTRKYLIGAFETFINSK